MKAIKSSYAIESIPSVNDLKKLEQYIRVCYKSEDKITEDSYKKLIPSIIRRGHTATIEHLSATVRIICDRGVTHELVRHRLASFCQESTRYVNYGGKDIEFIKPEGMSMDEDLIWTQSMMDAEQAYNNMLDCGCSPQIARSVLPNSTKTEIIITANLREWRHIFNMRADNAAHPQMREIMIPLLAEFKTLLPEIFGDFD